VDTDTPLFWVLGEVLSMSGTKFGSGATWLAHGDDIDD
jgi:hypothetical protein